MFYTLKSKGALHGCVHEGKPYVIAYNNFRLAHRIGRIMKSPPDITLHRDTVIDVTREVNNLLMDIGFKESDFQEITLDISAQLHIQKAPKNEITDVNYDLEVMDQSDFFFLNFGKNLGLIMPQEKIEETDDKVVFLSSVVDPAINIDQFRKSLTDLI